MENMKQNLKRQEAEDMVIKFFEKQNDSNKLRVLENLIRVIPFGYLTDLIEVEVELFQKQNGGK